MDDYDSLKNMNDQINEKDEKIKELKDQYEYLIKEQTKEMAYSYKLKAVLDEMIEIFELSYDNLPLHYKLDTKRIIAKMDMDIIPNPLKHQTNCNFGKGLENK